MYTLKTLNKNKLVPLKIIQIVKLENQTILKTDNGSITLLNYITIEKPKNNILIINSIADLNTSDSYLFNLNKIPFSSFHFYTRVYRTYYDFTGLKFEISNSSIIRLTKDDNRYKFEKISNVFNKVN